MPVAAAVVAGGVGLFSASKAAKAQSKASSQAAASQAEASQAAIDEQKRQFDALQKLFEPYVNAGTGSLSAQQNILGLNGTQAQQQAYDQIANSPAMQSMLQQGENSLLQNASATGGLRGGNIQGALAQYRPQLLNQLVSQQYQNLGGITSLGQNSAAQNGNAGMASASNIGNLLQSQGAYQAGNYLTQGKLASAPYDAISGLSGQLLGSALGKIF